MPLLQAGMLLCGASRITPDKRGVELVITDERSAVADIPFSIDPKVLFGHPYFWAPVILMGNWVRGKIEAWIDTFALMISTVISNRNQT